MITTTEVIDELIKLAEEINKAIKEGKELKLTEEELAFYDLFSTKEKFFENYQQIKEVAKKLVTELGYYMKIVEWIDDAIKKIPENSFASLIPNRFHQML